MKNNGKNLCKNLKDIKCPVCLSGKILIAKSSLHNSKIQIYSPECVENADIFVKCPKCKNQIGIGIKVNT